MGLWYTLTQTPAVIPAVILIWLAVLTTLSIIFEWIDNNKK